MTRLQLTPNRQERQKAANNAYILEHALPPHDQDPSEPRNTVKTPLADELRGKPKTVVNKRMLSLLPADVHVEFNAAVKNASGYLDYCSVIENYGKRFNLGFGPYDLTSLHDEDPGSSSLIRHS